jgi:hypothetical protein
MYDKNKISIMYPDEKIVHFKRTQYFSLKRFNQLKEKVQATIGIKDAELMETKQDLSGLSEAIRAQLE